MALITAAQAQARGVGLALDAVTLQAIIDDEEAIMVQRYGAHGDGTSSVTEIARREGGSVFLRRVPVSITSVTQAEYPGGTASTIATTERYSWLNGEARIELYPASTPYAAQYDEGKLITVIYVPVDDRAKRRSVLLELVRIATEQPTASGGGKVSGLGFSVDEGGGSSSFDLDAARARACRKLEFFST
jgi:hypothetical protein